MKTTFRGLGPVSVLVLIAATGCARAEPAPSVAAASVSAPAASSGASARARGSDIPVDGRLVISEAELSVRTKTPEKAADETSRYIAAQGGFVVTKEADRSEDAVTRVHMTVRVPSAKFEATLSELRKYGMVLKEAESGKDVTEEHADTEAELRAKRKLEERLLAIVEASKMVKEMLEVESELTRVRADIERLEGHAQYLEDRASLATIDLTFVSPNQPVPVEDESVSSELANALRTSGTVFVRVTTGVIIALGALAPFSVPVLGGLAWRRRRRRLAGALLSAS